MANRLFHLTKSIFSFLVILSFLISLIALPSFRPSHVAMASDRSFIIALIGYKPIIVRLENNTAYAHFDGLIFQGGFVSSGDNFIFDLYAYTDNTTANLEFLYNSFQVMAPYRYALYRLENGIYKPVKSSQWHYGDIVKLRKKNMEKATLRSFVQQAAWKNIFNNKRIYFIANKVNSLSQYSANEKDTYGPIKAPSQLYSITTPDSVIEIGHCVESTGNIFSKFSQYHNYNKPIETSRIVPMAAELTFNGQQRQAGFAFYIRGDTFKEAAQEIFKNGSTCQQEYINKNPDISGFITNINLKYWVSVLSDNVATIDWATVYSSNTKFNPYTENGGSIIATAANIFASITSLSDNELLSKASAVIATIVNYAAAYLSNANINIYENNDYVYVRTSREMSAQIGIINPDPEDKLKWRDTSYIMPYRHPEYPFVPFHVSFSDYFPHNNNPIRLKVLNSQGTIWVDVIVSYDRDTEELIFKMPIHIQLRYRLVK